MNSIYRTKYLSLLFSVIISCMVLFSGCSQTSEPISDSGIYFDTVISITIYDKKETDLLEDCFALCQEYEAKFSRTIDSSEISRINAADGASVEVSDDTIQLIKQGLYYSQLSDGAFDITIAPVSSLWDFQNNEKQVPSDKSIKEALTHVDYKNVRISGNSVTLKDPDAAIDLGGIAKGYIADQLKKYLESKNVKSALINLGGNVLTIGSKTDGSDFNIGIQKPFDEQNASITTVQVHDQSVVSSGVYERYFKSDGKLYHHILDTTTGYPTENNLLGVTIISDKSVDGDGLSTTCFVLGMEKGMQLINQLDGVDAIFITDDYKMHKTSGL